MKILIKKFWKITLFGIAMGFLEAAVVIYLRAIIYPEGFCFPLKDIPSNLFLFEIGREISTILMLITVSMISGRDFLEKLCFFIYTFGIWDIFYYIWLKITLGWPASIITDDLLFLIPVPWVGPVLAPIMVSITMILFALFLAYLKSKTYILRINKIDWMFLITASTVIFISFVFDSRSILLKEMPSPYHWELLVIAELIVVFVLYRIYRRKT